MAMSLMASSFTIHSPLSLLRPSLSPPRHHTLSSSLPKPQHHSPQILCSKSSRNNYRQQQRPQAQTTSSSFYPRAGVALYKPKSYEVLVDAANSLAFALQDGKTRLEIDFP